MAHRVRREAPPPARDLWNAFEAVIERTESELLAHYAAYASSLGGVPLHLTGTGPAVFLLVHERAKMPGLRRGPRTGRGRGHPRAHAHARRGARDHGAGVSAEVDASRALFAGFVSGAAAAFATVAIALWNMSRSPRWRGAGGGPRAIVGAAAGRRAGQRRADRLDAARAAARRGLPPGGRPAALRHDRACPGADRSPCGGVRAAAPERRDLGDGDRGGVSRSAFCCPRWQADGGSGPPGGAARSGISYPWAAPAGGGPRTAELRRRTLELTPGLQRSVLDMHVHSAVASSDSTLNPHKLPDLGRAAGLTGANICEHDKMVGPASARRVPRAAHRLPRQLRDGDLDRPRPHARDRPARLRERHPPRRATARGTRRRRGLPDRRAPVPPRLRRRDGDAQGQRALRSDPRRGGPPPRLPACRRDRDRQRLQHPSRELLRLRGRARTRTADHRRQRRALGERHRLLRDRLRARTAERGGFCSKSCTPAAARRSCAPPTETSRASNRASSRRWRRLAASDTPPERAAKASFCAQSRRSGNRRRRRVRRGRPRNDGPRPGGGSHHRDRRGALRRGRTARALPHLRQPRPAAAAPRSACSRRSRTPISSGRPPPSLAVHEFAAFARGLPLVAPQRAVRPRDSSPRRACSLRRPAYDSYEFASVLLPTATRLDLRSLAESLGVEVTEAHRALADAETTAAVFLRLLGRLEALPAATLRDLVRLAEQSAWSLAPLFGDALARRGVEAPALGDGPRARRAGARAAGVAAAAAPAPAVRAPRRGRGRGALRRGASPRRSAPRLRGARGPDRDGARRRGPTSPTTRQLAVEAGTGTGKSLAYLVPAALARAAQRGARRDLDAHAEPAGTDRRARHAGGGGARRVGGGRAAGLAADGRAEGAGQLPLPRALVAGDRIRGAAAAPIRRACSPASPSGSARRSEATVPSSTCAATSGRTGAPSRPIRTTASRGAARSCARAGCFPAAGAHGGGGGARIGRQPRPAARQRGQRRPGAAALPPPRRRRGAPPRGRRDEPVRRLRRAARDRAAARRGGGGRRLARGLAARGGPARPDAALARCRSRPARGRDRLGGGDGACADPGPRGGDRRLHRGVRGTRQRLATDDHAGAAGATTLGGCRRRGVAPRTRARPVGAAPAARGVGGRVAANGRRSGACLAARRGRAGGRGRRRARRRRCARRCSAPIRDGSSGSTAAVAVRACAPLRSMSPIASRTSCGRGAAPCSSPARH